MEKEIDTEMENPEEMDMTSASIDRLQEHNINAADINK